MTASTLEVTRVLRAPGPKPLANGRFVVELTSSARPFNPRDVPHLDLFGIYRLYHHIEGDEGRVRHVLRLGFFNDAAAAQAVARYAGSYFDSARVAQISPLEETESRRHAFRAMKDVGATGRFAAIELSAPPCVPPAALLAAPATAAATAAPTPRPPSFWTRLFAIPRGG